MVHFHPPSAAEEINHSQATRNATVGLILFAAYSSMYLCFMILNAFAPQTMEVIVVAGLNLAVVYGLGLIVAAFLLALLYAWLCRRPVPAEPAR